MLEKIKDSNEHVLWSGKPNRFVYTVGNPSIYIVAVFFGAFDFLFIKNFMSSGFGNSPFNDFQPILFGFFIFHLTPVWIAVFMPVYRFFSWKNIEYAVTDRRNYLVSGLFGRDIVSVEHRDVRYLNVDVNPVENFMNLGTVQLRSPNNDNARNITKFSFRYIENPYDVYNLVKKVSLDVYTDQQFPNMYRPNENTGYNTKYRGDE